MSDEQELGPEWPDHPSWKRKQNRPRTPRTADERRERKEKKRAKAIVAHCVQEAIGELGGKDFFVALGRAGGEDRRCLALIAARLIPSEVVGQVNASLSVTVKHIVLDQDGRLIDAPAAPIALSTP